jgi:UDP-N-acetylglucosamine 2-epimerase (non-hydrolysing)
MQILNVVGARPNLMKIAPLVREMGRHPAITPVLVHTGQHYDPQMSDIFFAELGIPAPDIHLGVGSGSHGAQTGRIMAALEPVLLERRPDLLLVVGDVNSTLAGTLVAAKLGVPVAHVEAGLRSFDRTMPEEINRLVTDALADFLFTTEPAADANLRREGVPEGRIFFVGNVLIDTLLAQQERARALDMPARYGLPPGGYALLTLHRPSSVDEPATLVDLVGTLAAVQTRLPLIFPLHPRTAARLQAAGLQTALEALPHLRLTEPLGYLEFLGLLAAARLVLTDSGGIQEETTILQVPCLTLRTNTERPITLEQGTNRLVGHDRAQILAGVDGILAGGGKQGAIPPLWDGHAAERIVAVLRDH